MKRKRTKKKTTEDDRVEAGLESQWRTRVRITRNTVSKNVSGTGLSVNQGVGRVVSSKSVIVKPEGRGLIYSGPAAAEEAASPAHGSTCIDFSPACFPDSKAPQSQAQSPWFEVLWKEGRTYPAHSLHSEVWPSEAPSTQSTDATEVKTWHLSSTCSRPT